MIEQALHVLMLHILWKTKGLTAEADPTPDEIQYKEVLQEQQEALLEKLVEYAQTQLMGSNERYVSHLWSRGFDGPEFIFDRLSSIYSTCMSYSHPRMHLILMATALDASFIYQSQDLPE